MINRVNVSFCKREVLLMALWATDAMLEGYTHVVVSIHDAFMHSKVDLPFECYLLNVMHDYPISGSYTAWWHG